MDQYPETRKAHPKVPLRVIRGTVHMCNLQQVAPDFLGQRFSAAGQRGRWCHVGNPPRLMRRIGVNAWGNARRLRPRALGWRRARRRCAQSTSSVSAFLQRPARKFLSQRRRARSARRCPHAAVCHGGMYPACTQLFEESVVGSLPSQLSQRSCQRSAVGASRRRLDIHGHVALPCTSQRNRAPGLRPALLGQARNDEGRWGP